MAVDNVLKQRSMTLGGSSKAYSCVSFKIMCLPLINGCLEDSEVLVSQDWPRFSGFRLSFRLDSWLVGVEALQNRVCSSRFKWLWCLVLSGWHWCLGLGCLMCSLWLRLSRNGFDSILVFFMICLIFLLYKTSPF